METHIHAAGGRWLVTDQLTIYAEEAEADIVVGCGIDGPCRFGESVMLYKDLEAAASFQVVAARWVMAMTVVLTSSSVLAGWT